MILTVGNELYLRTGRSLLYCEPVVEGAGLAAKGYYTDLRTIGQLGDGVTDIAVYGEDLRSLLIRCSRRNFTISG